MATVQSVDAAIAKAPRRGLRSIFLWIWFPERVVDQDWIWNKSADTDYVSIKEAPLPTSQDTISGSYPMWCRADRLIFLVCIPCTTWPSYFFCRYTIPFPAPGSGTSTWPSRFTLNHSWRFNCCAWSRRGTHVSTSRARPEAATDTMAENTIK